ncbi:hypothetical protein [Klebsiella pneumoniae]|nr:hypothetical protein [Klebsiella pneumoniae]HBT5985749.1 hypothetical protein [Klebsiella pneumoniae]HBV9527782.1 hypothetical protein [Klebsiella pneumoniae]HCM6549010.1 hypothetical protein [Klebsiella pneumoniae]HEE3128156.1 hypothetical protein [Klebsiella pneumoniae]
MVKKQPLCGPHKAQKTHNSGRAAGKNVMPLKYSFLCRPPAVFVIF